MNKIKVVMVLALAVASSGCAILEKRRLNKARAEFEQGVLNQVVEGLQRNEGCSQICAKLKSYIASKMEVLKVK